MGQGTRKFRVPFSFAAYWVELTVGRKMAVSPELIEILRCPKCKSKVELKVDYSALKCTNAECSLVYPIKDDIPVMIIEEATVEKA
jgi:uncharacterized protein